MRAHLTSDCPNRVVKCEDCAKTFQRSQAKDHFCRESHMRIVKAKNTEISKLMQRVADKDIMINCIEDPSMRKSLGQIEELTSKMEFLKFDYQSHIEKLISEMEIQKT